MREWKEAPTLPWFLGWTTGVNYDVFFWARKREAFSSLSSQWSAIFSYPFCLFPLLTLTGLAFSSFPTVLQVVASLTSNSSWLWSTSEVLCFLIWKTWPHKVHAFVPTFFFLSEMCNLPIFFQANFASLLKPCLAMTSSVKSFPAQNADYVVHPVLLHPLVHISIAGHSTYCIVCLFCLHLLTIPSLTQDYH